MKRSVLGLIVLAVGVIVASRVDWGALQRDVPASRDPVALSIFYVGEKRALLETPEIARIIEQRHRIDLDAMKAGAIKMAMTLDSIGKACLWPSNMIAADLARDAGKPVLGDETMFNSPIVFYAWADVADALVAKGVVRRHLRELPETGHGRSADHRRLREPDDRVPRRERAICRPDPPEDPHDLSRADDLRLASADLAEARVQAAGRGAAGPGGAAHRPARPRLPAPGCWRSRTTSPTSRSSRCPRISTSSYRCRPAPS